MPSPSVADNQKSVRGCLGWGFYAEFLWAINHLHYCKTTNKTPVIYWNHSFAYYKNDGYRGSLNGWEYFFEPVSSEEYKPSDTLENALFYPDKNFTVLWNYNQYIDELNLLSTEKNITLLRVTHGSFPPGPVYPVGNYHLYSQVFREYVKTTIIDPYIRLKPEIKNRIESFYNTHMLGKKTIGIHLRGSFIWNEVPSVSPEMILSQANKLAGPSVQFFVATDQDPLIEKAQKILKGNVLFIDSQRFSNSTAPIAGGAKLDPTLAEDVIIEMVLLSKCDYLFHTISNVSTTVLYFNPALAHTVLY